MRHRARGFGNDCRVSGIDLDFVGVQFKGDAANGRSERIGDEFAFDAGDRSRECIDGGGLIDTNSSRRPRVSS